MGPACSERAFFSLSKYDGKSFLSLEHADQCPVYFHHEIEDIHDCPIEKLSQDERPVLPFAQRDDLHLDVEKEVHSVDDEHILSSLPHLLSEQGYEFGGLHESLKGNF